MAEEPRPLRDLAEGMTRAALDFGKDSIVALAQRFRDRELRFIQDEATIENVRQERHSREYAGYEPFLKSAQTRVPVQMGLFLRKHARDAVIVENLRSKVRRRFKTPGLHLAQAAQAGLLNVLMGELRKVETPGRTYEEEVLQLFESIDDYAMFLETGANVDAEVHAAHARLRNSRPPVLAIAASGQAMDVAERVARGLLGSIGEDYEVQKVQKGQEIAYVFTRREG